MANVILGAPVYSDVGVLHTPAFDASGSWDASNPLTNLQSPKLWKVARSASVHPADTRCAVDLGADRAVRVAMIPKHTLSSAGKWRLIGRPSTLAFAYVAGEDIFARGGVFARVPTADVRTGSYIDRAGVLRYAAENRLVQSEAMGTTWVASNITVASDAVTGPRGTLTADTLTASAGNGTLIQDAGTLASAAFCFSAWVKRKTGTGNIDLTLNNGGAWTTVTVTAEWTRVSITATVANPDCGFRVVTNGDAIYVWGAQLNLGATPDAYVPTTTAACGAPRDDHWISDERTLLLEAAGTNLCRQSENLGTTWNAVGTPTRSAAAHTASGVTLDLIGDDDGAALEGYFITNTFTGDATKAVAVFVKAGTSTSSAVRLLDVTAAANRLLGILTWSGGLPSVAMTTGTYLGYETLADGVFRLLFTSTSVTAANTNSLQIYPATDAALATTATGTLYAGGFQAENAVVPSSYIPTTTATVTRAADSLYFPFTTTPQEMTVYLRGRNRGVYSNIGSLQRSLHIGSGADTSLDVRFSMGREAAGNLFVLYDNGAASNSVITSPTIALNDVVEHRGVITSLAAARSSASINSAAEVTGDSPAATTTGASAFAAERLYLTGGLSGQNGMFAYTNVTVQLVTQTLATMQAAVSDSGWLDAWPAGLTAEDVDGLNFALTHVVPSSAFTARYWSLQFDDRDNAAGFIDLHRLLLTGGFQPTANFIEGATLALESDTTTVYADGGNAIRDSRPMRRTTRFTLDPLTDAEAFLQAWRLQKNLGPDRQLAFVTDPDDTHALMIERAFCGVLRELTAIEYAYATFRRVPFAITEEL